MDNPVEVAFTPEGERFFTSTFLQHPGNGLRDGIAHAIYGGVYGKDHQVIEGLARTGPLMPIMTQLGPAAPSGLICLNSKALLTSSAAGDDARTLVAAQFNLQKISLHRLLPTQATFQTLDTDLLVANRIDFHPTDIVEDGDGSLLVIDTGGWYGLCCPTSRVDQQTAAGGIYRVRGSTQIPAQHRQPEIDWSQASVAACTALISDSRPWVSRMSLLRLQQIGDAAVEPLRMIMQDSGLPRERRLDGLWALSFVDTPSALEALATALQSDTAEVVQAACHAISVHRYLPAKGNLERLFSAADHATQPPSSGVLRAAAEALGRIGDAQSVDALMTYQRTAAADRILQHSCLYALMEIDQPQAVAAYLDSQWPENRAAALRVLSNLSNTPFLPQQAVLASLNGKPAEKQLAVEILCQRPQWLSAALPAIRSPEPDFMPLFSAWREQSALHQQMAEWIAAHHHEPSWQPGLEQMFMGWQGRSPPAACIQPLLAWFQHEPPRVLRLLSRLDLSAPDCKPLVEALHDSIHATPKLADKIAALQSLPANHSWDAPQLTQQLLDMFLQDSQAPLIAPALQRMRINPEHAEQLLGGLSDLPPTGLAIAVQAISTAQVDVVDQRLLEQLAELPAARTLPEGFIENLYRSRNPQLRDLAKSTARTLVAPSQDIAQQVQQCLSSLPEGDALRGLEVFRGSKAACAGCHQLGYVGGRIGPELTRIGQSRTREALLEAILFPSSRIEQSFQPMKILTIDGQVFNGLVLRRADDGVQLQLNADKSALIPHDQIEEMSYSQTSIMPAGMLEILSKQEIADLLSLLESGR